jgi:hypothetical protein
MCAVLLESGPPKKIDELYLLFLLVYLVLEGMEDTLVLHALRAIFVLANSPAVSTILVRAYDISSRTLSRPRKQRVCRPNRPFLDFLRQQSYRASPVLL